MAVLTPLGVTIKEEKGTALTHAEMDANMRLLKTLVNDSPQLAIAATFRPEHISITGITAISSDMADPSPELDTYLLDPLTITIDSFFEPSICDSLSIYMEPSGSLLTNITVSMGNVIIFDDLSPIFGAFGGEFYGSVPIILRFCPDDSIESFRLEVGTYTQPAPVG